jgi:hypothetical protein
MHKTIFIFFTLILFSTNKSFSQELLDYTQFRTASEKSPFKDKKAPVLIFDSEFSIIFESSMENILPVDIKYGKNKYYIKTLSGNRTITVKDSINPSLSIDINFGQALASKTEASLNGGKVYRLKIIKTFSLLISPVTEEKKAQGANDLGAGGKASDALIILTSVDPSLNYEVASNPHIKVIKKEDGTINIYIDARKEINPDPEFILTKVGYKDKVFHPISLKPKEVRYYSVSDPIGDKIKIEKSRKEIEAVEIELQQKEAENIKLQKQLEETKKRESKIKKTQIDYSLVKKAEDDYMKGKQNALINYVYKKKYNYGVGCLLPIIGFPITLIDAFIPPNDCLETAPLSMSSDFYKGYKKGARIKKNKKIWVQNIMGTVVTISVLLLL